MIPMNSVHNFIYSFHSFRRKYIELNSKNENIGAHVFELLQLQIWSILPSFCNNAQDVHDNFKSIARILGNLISERKQLRLPAMASLRKLINRSQGNCNPRLYLIWPEMEKRKCYGNVNKMSFLQNAPISQMPMNWPASRRITFHFCSLYIPLKQKPVTKAENGLLPSTRLR